MTITTREKVREAVERALLLDQHRDVEDAVEAVACALCLTAETVREALLLVDEEQLS